MRDYLKEVIGSKIRWVKSHTLPRRQSFNSFNLFNNIYHPAAFYRKAAKDRKL